MTCTRRDFVSRSVAGLVAAALPLRFAHAQRPTSQFRVLRRNVGIFTARGGTIGWLADPAGAVVVDSQFPDSAETCLAGLRERNADRVDALINTHHHGDHTAGNAVFRPVAERIVAHRSVPERQRRAAEANESAGPQAYADATFEEEWSIEVGDETVRARYYGPAHTGGDCTVHFERADIVHMGDLVFNRAYPFIDRAGGASVRGWIELLERVSEAHSAETIYVFGHARPEFGVTGSREDILLQRDLLSAVLEIAERAVAAGRSREEATALERLPAFPDHDALANWLTLAAPLGAAYDEVAGRGA